MNGNTWDKETCTKCLVEGLCFKHKIKTVSLSPAATPTRKNNVPPAQPNPAWEKGIYRDDRGMPLLNENGSYVGVKNAHKYRKSQHESWQKTAHQRLTED